eukprot:1158900-Pelagomonas_calceolata.AAC.2
MKEWGETFCIVGIGGPQSFEDVSLDLDLAISQERMSDTGPKVVGPSFLYLLLTDEPRSGILLASF